MKTLFVCAILKDLSSSLGRLGFEFLLSEHTALSSGLTRYFFKGWKKVGVECNAFFQAETTFTELLL